MGPRAMLARGCCWRSFRFVLCLLELVDTCTLRGRFFFCYSNVFPTTLSMEIDVLSCDVVAISFDSPRTVECVALCLFDHLYISVYLPLRVRPSSRYCVLYF
jgi:hypothetical protein